MILFGILGSYLFLHIRENILLILGKYVLKIHEIGKIKVIFGLGMTPIYSLKNGQIKSLESLSLSALICKAQILWALMRENLTVSHLKF